MHVSLLQAHLCRAQPDAAAHPPHRRRPRKEAVRLQRQARAKVSATNVPYAISYSVAAGSNGARWVVTVTAQPTTSGVRYQGMIGAGKVVTYVSTIQ